MAEDIVTRLRELGGDWDYVGLVPGDDLREAADEIERLRNYPKTGAVQTSDAADDIVFWLRDKVPYGLTDYTLLADAANHIERLDREIMRRDGVILELRAEVQRLEQVTRG